MYRSAEDCDIVEQIDVTQLGNAGPSVSGERDYVTAAHGERQSDLTLTSISVDFRQRRSHKQNLSLLLPTSLYFVAFVASYDYYVTIV